MDAVPLEGTPYVVLRDDVWTVGGRIVFTAEEVEFWLAHLPALRTWLETLEWPDRDHADQAAAKVLGFATETRDWESLDVGEFLFLALWGHCFWSPSRAFEWFVETIVQLTKGGMIEPTVSEALQRRMHGAFEDYMLCYAADTDLVRRRAARKHR